MCVTEKRSLKGYHGAAGKMDRVVSLLATSSTGWDQAGEPRYTLLYRHTHTQCRLSLSLPLSSLVYLYAGHTRLVFFSSLSHFSLSSCLVHFFSLSLVGFSLVFLPHSLATLYMGDSTDSPTRAEASPFDSNFSSIAPNIRQKIILRNIVFTFFSFLSVKSTLSSMKTSFFSLRTTPLENLDFFALGSHETHTFSSNSSLCIEQEKNNKMS